MPDPGEGPFGAAFEALDVAGVSYSFRKDSARNLDPPPGGEVDISLDRAHAGAADVALARAGFHAFSAPGHGSHRFYLGFSAGRWLKIDARLEGGASKPLALRRLAGRRPAALRRLGPVVAVVGPDGAGKGTVIRSLAEEIPVEVKVLYLGWRKPGAARPRQASGDRRRAGPALESAFVLKGWARAGLILLRGYAAAWRGAIVLCDRHPSDALAVRARRNPGAEALERALLEHFTPWPDAVVVLDAPTDVLLRRKSEHPREVIERWRKAYVDVFGNHGGVVVSSEGRRDATVAHAASVVWDALRRRRRWKP